MKICLCSQEYPPDTHVGGIGTYTYNMAGALAAMGHTVHVLTSTPECDRNYRENGVVVHRIRDRKCRPLELSRLRYSHAVASKLSRIGCTFDIVQTSEYAAEAFWLSLRRRIPLVTRLATPTFLLEKLNADRSERWFCNFMERQQTLRSDGIFASTKALARAVAKKWEIDCDRIEVIPNSVDISRIIRLGETGNYPGDLRGREFILYFGHLEERKGVRVLADALPTVLQEFRDLLMLFVGTDMGYRGVSMREYIRARAGRDSDRIKFFDNLPHPELMPIVHAAKVVILPSLWEAFGFVSVEAMALGRPVIASSGSGFEEIIEDNSSGYLVEPGNWKALADKILHVLRDETGREKISSAAAKRAREFEVSRIAVKLVDYLEQINARYFRKDRCTQAGAVS